MESGSNTAGIFAISLAILSVPLLFLFVFGMLKLMERTLRKELTPLHTALGGEIVQSFFTGTYLKLLRDGLEVRINLTLGGRNAPPYMHLQWLSPLGFNLHVSKENFVTRGLNRLGALKEVRLGLPAVDDRFFIRAADETAAMSYLMDRGRYETVDWFFQQGFNMFTGNNKTILLAKPRYTAVDLESNQVQEYLARMKNLLV